MKFLVRSTYSSDAYDILNKYPIINGTFEYEIKDCMRKYKNNLLFVNINTVEELMKFKEMTVGEIIIDEDNDLVIYDGYVE